MKGLNLRGPRKRRSTGISPYGASMQEQFVDACFRDLFEDSKDTVYVTSREGNILTINKAGVELFGYSREEMIGMDISTCYADPYDRQRFRQEIERTGAVKDYEVQLLRKDGTRLSCLITSTLRRSPEGEIIGYQGFIRDVTSYKEAEEALRRSEEKFSKIFRSSPDWIAISALEDGRLIDVNDAFLKITGYAREEVIGKTSTELGLWVDPAERKRFVKLLREKREVRDHEAKFRLKSGEVRIFLRSAELIELEGQTCMINITRDITERRRAEEEIRKLNGELQRRVAELIGANRELDAFGHSVSHDLRAPLITIGGFAGRLLKNYSVTLDAKGIEMLGTIQSNVKKMEALISDLLTFSRMGRQAMKFEEVDMEELVRAVFKELKAGARGRDVELRSTGLLQVYADRVLIRQVIVNLLSNAMKFTRPRDKAVIEVESTKEEDCIVYCVKDNGVGFDMKFSENLFDAFQRAHTDDFEGTGIGLSIVHRIITRHGGRIWAEGKVGEGAAFYFTLPAERKNKE
jgi:PAS domain S-box-containing protein